jgi:hypothetical protein
MRISSKLLKWIIGILAIVVISAYYYIGFDFWNIGSCYTKDEIELYAKEHNFYTEYIQQKNYRMMHSRRHPNYKIYNTEDMAIQLECQPSAKKIIERLGKMTDSFFIPSDSLALELRYLDNGEALVRNYCNSKKTTMVYFYNMWSPIYNKKNMFPMIDSMNAHSDKFQIILVNIDTIGTMFNP